MVIAYCEGCSAKVDGDTFVDPITAAKYCATCAGKIPRLVKQSGEESSATRSSSSRSLQPGRRTPTPAQPAENLAPFLQPSGTTVFFFCESCGRRIKNSDLEQGRALKDQGRGTLCKDCARAAATVTSDAIPIDEPKTASYSAGSGRKVPEAGGVLSAQTSARSRNKSESNEMLGLAQKHWIVAGAAAVVLLALAFALFRKTSPEAINTIVQASASPAALPAARPAQSDPVAQVSTPHVKAVESTPVQLRPLPSSQPVSASPVNSPPDRRAASTEDDSFINARANALLNEARDAFAAQSIDPWIYKVKLEKLTSAYRSTPAAQEALKLLAHLKLPPESERTPDGMDWHKQWKITEGADEVEFYAEFDSREFVYRSHPIAPDRPCETARAFYVTEQRPYLQIRLRAHEDGDHRFAVRINGREMMNEIQSGKDWRELCFDLTEFKGRTVEISMLHSATDWYCEHVYIQAPRFIEKPPANAKIFR